MRVIRYRLYEREACLCIYDQKEMIWQKRGCYRISGQSCVYSLLKQQKIRPQIASINLNLAYRNTFYALIPDIKIMIEPEWLLIVAGLLCSRCWQQDEIAADLDRQIKDEKQEVQTFIRRLYQCHTKSQARKCYENWQLSRTRASLIGDRFQTIMELFEEEIFNYFDYQKLFLNIYE